MTTFTWHQNVWHDASDKLSAGGTSANRALQVPLDESLLRVIYRRSSWGSLDVADPDKLIKPAQGYCETVLSVNYLTDDPEPVYTAFRPMLWGQGWTLVQPLDNKSYWTWSIGPGFELDLELRRGPGVEAAHALAVNFLDSISFDDLGAGFDRSFPSYSSWTSARWLTSKL